MCVCIYVNICARMLQWSGQECFGIKGFALATLSLRCLLDIHAEMLGRPLDICNLNSEKWIKAGNSDLEVICI